MTSNYHGRFHLVAKYVLEELRRKSMETNTKHLAYSYINCRTVNTHYRILARLCNDLNLSRKKVPFTGLPTDEVFQKFRRKWGKPRKKRCCHTGHSHADNGYRQQQIFQADTAAF